MFKFFLLSVSHLLRSSRTEWQNLERERLPRFGAKESRAQLTRRCNVGFKLFDRFLRKCVRDDLFEHRPENASDTDGMACGGSAEELCMTLDGRLTLRLRVC